MKTAISFLAVFLFCSTTLAAPATPSAKSLFKALTPANPDASDGVPYELGAKFQTRVNGQILAIRYWKSPSETGAHTGRVWSANGKQLASAEFENESAQGWQEAKLATPLKVQANATYIVSVNVNTHFPTSPNGLNANVGSGELLAVAASGAFGPPGKLPTQTFQNSNYFRDVVFSAQPGASMKVEPMIHRSYLGWVRDLASEPRPNLSWPQIDIDAGLLRDYDQTFALMQKSGLNEIVLWGLFTERNWSPDVEGTIDAVRAAQVRDLIARAHARGLKVLYGGGLYSWGFERIIAAHPELGGGHKEIMLPTSPLAWEYQKRIFDYVFTFPFDGVSMQSADLGRNDSPETKGWSDIRYHAFLNEKAAKYIKAAYPGKMIAVSGWGMNFSNRADLPYVVQMTRDLDYLIDVQDSAAPWRAELIEAIRPCVYGTTGSPNVEPPSHWNRDRWFLPILKRMAIQLQTVHAQGGRAVETYMRVLSNPGEEAALRVAARVELNPATSWESVADEVLNELYKPKTVEARARLLKLFERAENAYYDNASVGAAEIVRVEPLEGSNPGPPIYLQDRMNAQQLDAYATEMKALREEARVLESQVEDTQRMKLVGRCIENALLDVEATRKTKSSGAL